VNKRYRLKKNREFQYTYKKGRSFGHPLLVLISRKTRLPVTRIGFSITKKFGKAVRRNRIKRQLREILRQRLPYIKTGYDIIFVVRKEAKDTTYSKLDQAVYNLLKRSNLLIEGEKTIAKADNRKH
jgi:ribonuclease P protein component